MALGTSTLCTDMDYIWAPSYSMKSIPYLCLKLTSSDIPVHHIRGTISTTTSTLGEEIQNT